MSETEKWAISLNWRKSSHSISNGACLEAAAVVQTLVVRDSVNPADGQLRFPAQAWREFIACIKDA